MDRQTLRDWVQAYNAHGIDGLMNKTSPISVSYGRPPKLLPEQKVEIAALAEAGPDFEKDGLVRWRRIDLARIAKFTETLSKIVKDVAPETKPEIKIEIWFQDEMRLGKKNGQKSGKVRQWAKRGARPRQPADQRYESTYIFGAVCRNRIPALRVCCHTPIHMRCSFMLIKSRSM